jgi:hypothetical protein
MKRISHRRFLFFFGSAMSFTLSPQNWHGITQRREVKVFFACFSIMSNFSKDLKN